MLFLIGLLPLVAGWGSLGHRTVAYLAQLHFTPAAHQMTLDLLNGQDISEAALFPDKVVHMPSFAYTAGWHYIDAQDDPPRTCAINMTRDCANGCVVTAIANHTGRVLDDTLSHALRGQSLRFVLHFFGDIHQPLHTENEDRGGNEIPVVFDGKKTNLHSVWDTLIPKKYRGSENETADAHAWARELFEDEPIHECLVNPLACALQWARESNQLVCSYVLKNDLAGLDDDLGDDYYEGAKHIVDAQVTKAGRRLAVWINTLASSGLVLQT